MRKSAVLLVIAVLFSCSKNNEPKGAVITHVSGEVIIEHLDSSTEKARIKTTVNPNDTIITKKRSLIVLQIPGNGVIRIMENSRVFINSLTENKAGVMTTLFNGSIFSKIMKKKKYKILTKIFTAEASGTEFLTIKNDYAIETLVFKGAVTVSALALNKQQKLTEGRAGTLFDNKDLLIQELDPINMLKLKRLSVPDYIEDLDDLSVEEINIINNKNRETETTLDKETEKVNKQLEEKCASATMSKEATGNTFFKPIASYKGHKYYLSTFKTTWEKARSLCAAHGGNLVTVTGPGEHDAIYKGIWNNNPFAPVWIGLKRKKDNSDSWEWTTGERFSYSRWHPGQPDNRGHNQNYARLWDKKGYNTWEDNEGESPAYFIMEVK